MRTFVRPPRNLIVSGQTIVSFVMYFEFSSKYFKNNDSGTLGVCASVSVGCSLVGA